ncbi:alpha/beta fold hydrolase [Catellatospora bangladeshensis]|uniref:alpha/beta fold hydrolase n=1 Tax=Catellatospora bangladeshensis TaxID=310355 RepID=UPI00362057F9
MTVQTTHHGDVAVAYETFGPAGGEPLLLIMGLDYQMVWWPDGFCQALADRGFHVARFDNRDAGLSTHFTSPAKENPFRVLLRGSRRPRTAPPTWWATAWPSWTRSAGSPRTCSARRWAARSRCRPRCCTPAGCAR